MNNFKSTATHIVACLFLPICFLIPNESQAKEGMWIPTLLQALEGDMQAMGMRLSAEDIYSMNHSSLKDAIVHFGGGCTAEMVSSQGLLLTNHHCGYGQIQVHSSVENDYLKDGFWAMSRNEELPNEGLSATFIDQIIDVTERILKAVVGLEGEERALRINEEISAIEKEYLSGKFIGGGVVEFDFGNQFFLISKITYLDVRLVGAPPSAVGKFGGDTDNWVWPRHTGDFSVFRIYANSNNEPAEFSESNVPYTPKHHFPVSIDGVKEGDFTMVFGFPGSTEQYLTSDAVTHVIESLNPKRIAMRDVSLTIINSARSSSAELRIAYASKQSSISNAWKKWEGQSKGLIELGAVDKKLRLEREYVERAVESGRDDLVDVVTRIQEANAEYFPLMEARSLFIELVYYGPEILLHAFGFSDIIENWEALEENGGLEAAISAVLHINDEYARNYSAEVDEQLLDGLVSTYLEIMPNGLVPSQLEERYGSFNSSEEYAQDFFERSIFDNPEELEELLLNGKSKHVKKLLEDPALILINELREHYFTQVANGYSASSKVIKDATASYTRGLRDLFPERLFPIDANSTLRLTYGRVEGSSPHDGMTYNPLSTTKGILQKYKPGDPDFDLPEDLVQDLKEGDWGVYGTEGEDSELVVCFTGSNHTTGGNSGSPAINGNGELVGINFDRSWESTMSDILFDEARCRNIMVDIRYVLWIIDHYAGAGHLVEEMTVVNKVTP
jgi:hypothetical protein